MDLTEEDRWQILVAVGLRKLADRIEAGEFTSVSMDRRALTLPMFDGKGKYDGELSTGEEWAVTCTKPATEHR